MTTSKMRRAGATLALVAVTGLTVAACSDDDSSEASASEATEARATSTTAADGNTQSDAADEPATGTTIVDIAASNPDFSTLVTAVEAAGLAETLAGPGPFTVFAPTNDAFAKLPAGTVETLLDPANQDQLTSVLTYHVVPAEVMAADVTAGDVTTVNGATFSVATDGGVTISDGQGGTAKVVQTDIVASNGVIHVIDAVLLPPSS
jgi:uncharacterized surface protein with fasciclin (FAS1) repeats